MPRRLPPLNAVRAFEAAGRRGSFVGAAEELGVGHAAISRHVRGLERRLGVQLFRKLPRGLALTEEGEAYLAQIGPALDAIAEATESIGGDLYGRIRISCEPVFAIKWLVPRLSGFYDAHPQIEVDFDTVARLVDLTVFEADLAIRYTSAVADGLESDVICRLPTYPVGSPSLLERSPPITGPRDLLGFRLLHEDKGEGWRRWFTAAGLGPVRLPERPKPLNYMMAIEAAIAGHGVAVTSEELIEADLEAGRLVRFSDIGANAGGYFIVYMKERIRDSAVRAFRDWLLYETASLREA